MPMINETIANRPLRRWLSVRYLNINDKLANKDGKLFEGMTLDRLHPTIKGYQVWADALKPILTGLLGPPAKEDHDLRRPAIRPRRRRVTSSRPAANECRRQPRRPSARSTISRSTLHADQQERARRQDHQLRRDRHRAARARQGRQARGRRARLRESRRLRQRPSVLRRHRRPRRQPHRNASSRSTARRTSSTPTTRPTTCTAARRAGTRWSGTPRRSRRPTARRSS